MEEIEEQEEESSSMDNNERENGNLLRPTMPSGRKIIIPIIISTTAWILTTMATFSCSSIMVEVRYEYDYYYYEEYYGSGYYYKSDYQYETIGLRYPRCFPDETQLSEDIISSLDILIGHELRRRFAYGVVAMIIGGMATISTYFGCCIYYYNKGITCIIAGFLLAGSFFLVTIPDYYYGGCTNDTKERLEKGEIDLQSDLYDICVYFYWNHVSGWATALTAVILWFACLAWFVLWTIYTYYDPDLTIYTYYFIYYPDPAELKNCKKRRAVAVVKRNARLVRHLSAELKDDKEVVMAAVNKDGTALEYASPRLKNNKDVALAAVGRTPDAIKYVHEDLKRDQDLLIAAGMFDENHDINRTITNTVRKIVLSTRFSLNSSSDSEATNFTKLLKDHKYVQSHFKVYAPNAFDKQTCDPNWTDFDHPCRGTADTCHNKNVLAHNGRPTDDCCWRFSFRSQLVEAKETGGFMIQLVERDHNHRDGKPTLGMGQKIEQHMAQQLKLKVFHVYRPIDAIDRSVEFSFTFHDIKNIMKVIKVGTEMVATTWMNVLSAQHRIPVVYIS